MIHNFMQEECEDQPLSEEEEQEKHLMKYYGITSEQLHKEYKELMNDPNKKVFYSVEELFADLNSDDEEDDAD